MARKFDLKWHTKVLKISLREAEDSLNGEELQGLFKNQAVRIQSEIDQYLVLNPKALTKKSKKSSKVRKKL